MKRANIIIVAMGECPQCGAVTSAVLNIDKRLMPVENDDTATIVCGSCKTPFEEILRFHDSEDETPLFDGE